MGSLPRSGTTCLLTLVIAAGGPPQFDVRCMLEAYNLAFCVDYKNARGLKQKPAWESVFTLVHVR